MYTWDIEGGAYNTPDHQEKNEMSFLHLQKNAKAAQSFHTWNAEIKCFHCSRYKIRLLKVVKIRKGDPTQEDCQSSSVWTLGLFHPVWIAVTFISSGKKWHMAN